MAAHSSVAVVLLVMRLLRKLLPNRVKERDPKTPLYLDASASETPFVALEAATREAQSQLQ